jgi:curved DNA-binding protein
MEKPKDYYQLLGVARDASLTAIRRAFRRLARRFEPDRAEDAFAELQAA